MRLPSTPQGLAAREIANEIAETKRPSRFQDLLALYDNADSLQAKGEVIGIAVNLVDAIREVAGNRPYWKPVLDRWSFELSPRVNELKQRGHV